MNLRIADIGFSGRGDFSPTLLSNELNLPFKVMSDPTMPSKIGRYKGQKPPFGLGYHRVDLSELENTLLFLLKNKAVIEKQGVQEIIVHLFLDETSIHIESKVVHLLSQLKATIELHHNNQELQAA